MWQEMKDAYTTWRVKKYLSSCGDNLRARNPGCFHLGKGSEVHIGHNVLLERQVLFSTGENARIYIGDNTYLGDYTNILAVREVRIGKGCAISWHVLFMDTSSHPFGIRGQIPQTLIAPIIIEDHVWIAAGR
ncbi:acyltransferase [Syntrophomonas palmitatica]|uniref:acyltransferase n=1 Tax=Syntrophomonas palmitatica TaxID=402877 RepID=UPI000AF29F65|nr:hypothetical protein [Syntrophomonas palmitatica]